MRRVFHEGTPVTDPSRTLLPSRINFISFSESTVVESCAVWCTARKEQTQERAGTATHALKESEMQFAKNPLQGKGLSPILSFTGALLARQV